jgi:hypothetical protein
LKSVVGAFDDEVRHSKPKSLNDDGAIPSMRDREWQLTSARSLQAIIRSTRTMPFAPARSIQLSLFFLPAAFVALCCSAWLDGLSQSVVGIALILAISVALGIVMSQATSIVTWQIGGQANHRSDPGRKSPAPSSPAAAVADQSPACRLSASPWTWLLAGWAAPVAAGVILLLNRAVLSQSPTWVETSIVWGSLAVCGLPLAVGCFLQSRRVFRVPGALAWTSVIGAVHLLTWCVSHAILFIFTVAALHIQPH